MYFKFFLQQLRRGRKKTILYLLLLAVVTSFFTMSVNLYQNSVANLKSVEDAYSTLAVMELYGDVDEFGALTDANSEKCVGYRSVAVKGYDISDIVSADGVIDWDLRAKYGAYIEGQPAMWHENLVMAETDIFRFKIIGEEPVELPISWIGDLNYREPEPFDLKLKVWDSAAGCFPYNSDFVFGGITINVKEKETYRKQIMLLNRSNEAEKVILYPDVEYIVSNGSYADWMAGDEPGSLKILEVEKNGKKVKQKLHFRPDRSLQYGVRGLRVSYELSEESLGYPYDPQNIQPFYIQRFEDVKSDPELKAYFDGAWNAAKIQTCTYSVDLTNDLTSIPAYHLGGASLKEGRLITEEEYEKGAKVCMVSDQMAAYQGWKIGDKLDMQFFKSDAIVNSNLEMYWSQPVWTQETEGFFYHDQYEIVGFYTQNPVTGNSGIAPSTLAMPWYTIYIPEKAVENTTPVTERPVHGALLSIRLENGSIDRFLDDIEALGLTEAKEGEYQPVFSFYDQGYSLVQPGLEAMHGMAQLLLLLSALLLIVTCILLAFFFAQNQKQSVGIFRMLGGSRGKAIRAVLVCALLITVVGGGLGGIAGYGLTRNVGQNIIEKNLEESKEASAYQAYVLKSGNGEEQKMAVEADLGLTLTASGAAFLFPVLMLLFVLLYINKEPRELLPRGKG
ncbi:MAG: hypothetical protein Q4F21_12525 [Lachnospiraceae bacterium]|nr:hypothetical protein [Lachnospiraceae bacterium]